MLKRHSISLHQSPPSTECIYMLSIILHDYRLFFIHLRLFHIFSYDTFRVLC